MYSLKSVLTVIHKFAPHASLQIQSSNNSASNKEEYSLWTTNWKLTPPFLKEQDKIEIVTMDWNKDLLYSKKNHGFSAI